MRSSAAFIVLFTVVFGVTFGAMILRAKTPPPVFVLPTNIPTTKESVANTPVNAAPATRPSQQQVNDIHASKEEISEQLDRGLEACKELIEASMQQRQAFNTQFKALNLDRLLDAELLSNADRYAPARTDLRSATKLLNACETSIKAQNQGITARLKSAGLDDELRRAAINAISDSPGLHTKYFQRAIELERKRIEGLNKLLDFLEPRLSFVHVRNGALICDSPTDDQQLLKQLRQLSDNRAERLTLDAETFVAIEEARHR